MNIPSPFQRGRKERYRDFSVRDARGAGEVDVHSVEMLRTLFLKQSPLRYRPLVALLRGALRHRVMIVSDGAEWRRTHEAIHREFQAKLVEGEYAPMIRRVAREAFDALATSMSDGEFAEVEVESLMRTLTCSMMGQVMFGETLPMDEAKVLEKTLSVVTQVVDRGMPARINGSVGVVFRVFNLSQHQPVVFPRSQRRATKEMLAWIGRKIDATETASRRPPLLENLKVRYAEKGEGEQRRSVSAEFAMLFIAGIETTAAALTCAIAEIAGNAEIQAKVVAEARSAMPEAACSHALPFQYPYLYNVFRETLRRHTIVPTFLRETETEYAIPAEGSEANEEQSATAMVKLRRGATLRYLPLQGHMKRELWPNPRKFSPERFAQPLTVEQSRHYMPFGFGPQRCPGHVMARTEVLLILLEFFQRFDVETKALERSIPMERNAVFTNRPQGVRVRVRAGV